MNVSRTSVLCLGVMLAVFAGGCAGTAVPRDFSANTDVNLTETANNQGKVILKDDIQTGMRGLPPLYWYWRGGDDDWMIVPLALSATSRNKTIGFAGLAHYGARTVERDSAGNVIKATVSSHNFLGLFGSTETWEPGEEDSTILHKRVFHTLFGLVPVYTTQEIIRTAGYAPEEEEYDDSAAEPPTTRRRSGRSGFGRSSSKSGRSSGRAGGSDRRRKGPPPKRFQEVFAAPRYEWDLPGGAEISGGNLVVDDTEVDLPERYDNFTLTCTYRAKGDAGFRVRKDGDSYLIAFNADGSYFYALYDGRSEPEYLVEGNLNSYDPGRDNSLRIRANGRTITVTLNGKSLKKLSDDRLSSGKVSISPAPGGSMEIRKLQMQ